MKKGVSKAVLLILMTVFCFIGVVYAEDPALPGNTTIPGKGRGPNTGLPTDDELLSDPDVFIPGITDIFEKKMNIPGTDSVTGGQAPAKPIPSTPPTQTGQAKYNLYLKLEGLGLNNEDNLGPEHEGEYIIKSFELVGDISLKGSDAYLKVIKKMDNTFDNLFHLSITRVPIKLGKLTVYNLGPSCVDISRISFNNMEVISYKLIVDEKNPSEAYEEICFSFTDINFVKSEYSYSTMSVGDK